MLAHLQFSKARRSPKEVFYQGASRVETGCAGGS
jgi:hypothetical protein